MAEGTSIFDRVPPNPHTEKVQQFKAQVAAGAQPVTEIQQVLGSAGAPAASAPVASAPAAQPVYAPIERESIFATPKPPAPLGAVVQQLPVAEEPKQPAPVSPQASTVPIVDQYLLQQLAQEREALRAQLEERDRRVAELSKAQQELEQFKQQQKMNEALAAANFEGLESVEPEDAKRISAAVLAATQATITPLQKELEAQRQEMYSRLQQQQQYYQQQQIQAVNNKILTAHPDFFDLQKMPAYHEFMLQRDGLSSETRDQRAARELAMGNAEYVIDVLNQLKGRVGQTAQVTSVPPVQFAASNAAPVAQVAPARSLVELNQLRQMGLITPAEYSRQLPAARAAFYQ